MEFGVQTMSNLHPLTINSGSDWIIIKWKWFHKQKQSTLGNTHLGPIYQGKSKFFGIVTHFSGFLTWGDPANVVSTKSGQKHIILGLI